MKELKIAYQADCLSDARQDKEHPSAQSVDHYRRHCRRQHLHRSDDDWRLFRWDRTIGADEDALHVKQHEVDTSQLLERSQGTGINQGLAISLHLQQVGEADFILECFLHYHLEEAKPI